MSTKLTEAQLAYKYREKEEGNRATRRQENYIGYLMNMLGWLMEDREKYWREKGLSPLTLSRKQASEVIDDLKRKLYQGR